MGLTPLARLQRYACWSFLRRVSLQSLPSICMSVCVYVCRERELEVGALNENKCWRGTRIIITHTHALHKQAHTCQSCDTGEVGLSHEGILQVSIAHVGKLQIHLVHVGALKVGICVCVYDCMCVCVCVFSYFMAQTAHPQKKYIYRKIDVLVQSASKKEAATSWVPLKLPSRTRDCWKLTPCVCVKN